MIIINDYNDYYSAIEILKGRYKLEEQKSAIKNI